MTQYDSLAATMLAEDNQKPVRTLSLHSQLAEVARLWPWVDALGAEYSVPSDTLFAIHLCLEEALSNIIRHGYHGQPGQPIVVDFTMESGTDLVFTIEDQAPPFDPLAFEVSGKTGSPTDLLDIGGHGIRFLRKYSGGLGYQRMADGNRLTIRFSIRP
jgi:serine/threonine-protein kinase RsbW